MTPPSYIAWHGASLASHKTKRDHAIASGHRFASLSIYPNFSPVMSIATAKDWETTDLFAHYGLT